MRHRTQKHIQSDSYTLPWHHCTRIECNWLCELHLGKSSFQEITLWLVLAALTLCNIARDLDLAQHRSESFCRSPCNSRTHFVWEVTHNVCSSKYCCNYVISCWGSHDNTVTIICSRRCPCNSKTVEDLFYSVAKFAVWMRRKRKLSVIRQICSCFLVYGFAKISKNHRNSGFHNHHSFPCRLYTMFWHSVDN